MKQRNDFGWIRSALFVQGNQPDRTEKAILSKADAVIVDLEDAVAVVKKKDARHHARQIINQYPDRTIIVRVNALESEHIKEDLEAVITQNLSGLMVPKVETPRQVNEINEALLQVEKRLDRENDPVFVIPLIETARAVENALIIAEQTPKPDRVFTLAFGAADYSLDTGVTITETGEELIYPRSKLTVSCRAAGLTPPLDTPFMRDLKNIEALKSDIRRSVQFGFQGKLCIHLNQIGPCNDMFSPSTEDIAHAEAVVKVFSKAERKGIAAVQLNGEFIDYPVVERARRILKLTQYIS